MTTDMPIALITHQRYLDHDTGGNDHPEVPDRLLAITGKIAGGPLAGLVSTNTTRPAERMQLEWYHEPNYLYRFEEAALSGRSYIDHPDNQICFDSFEIAMLSAGAGLTAVDLIEQNNSRLPFCCVRPPGHHAEKNLALGFCFFNNVVIAVRYWQQQYNRRRIGVIDWDAHHGNGIQAAFEEDPDVLYISIHEHPTFSFPGTGYAEETGLGAGKGTTLNIPLRPGADDDTVKKSFAGKVKPALDSFRPDALLISAGFDGHILDDMSGLSYTTELYHYLGQLMYDYAQTYCHGRLVSILEGGYHLPSLADSVEAYLLALARYSK